MFGNARKVRKVTQEAWAGAIGQLNSIQSAEELGISTRGTMVKIAMVVVPFYTASVNKDNLNPFNKEEVEEILTNLLKGLTPSPNWSCTWLLHERLQDPFEYDDSFELYPCVGIVAQVDNSLSVKE